MIVYQQNTNSGETCEVLHMVWLHIQTSGKGVMAVVDKFAMKNLFSPIHNGFLNAKLTQYLNPDCNTKLEKKIIST